MTSYYTKIPTLKTIKEYLVFIHVHQKICVGCKIFNKICVRNSQLHFAFKTFLGSFNKGALELIFFLQIVKTNLNFCILEPLHCLWNTAFHSWATNGLHELSSIFLQSTSLWDLKLEYFIPLKFMKKKHNKIKLLPSWSEAEFAKSA